MIMTAAKFIIWFIRNSFSQQLSCYVDRLIFRGTSATMRFNSHNVNGSAMPLIAERITDASSRIAGADINHAENLFAITSDNLLISFLEGNRGRCRARSSKPLGDVRRSRWVRLPLSSAIISLHYANVRAILPRLQGCRIVRACGQRVSNRALSQYVL